MQFGKPPRPFATASHGAHVFACRDPAYGYCRRPSGGTAVRPKHPEGLSAQRTLPLGGERTRRNVRGRLAVRARVTSQPAGAASVPGRAPTPCCAPVPARNGPSASGERPVSQDDSAAGQADASRVPLGYEDVPLDVDFTGPVAAEMERDPREGKAAPIIGDNAHLAWVDVVDGC